MSLWNVKKRDGKMASFDSGKIHDAINKAFEATGLRDKEDEVSDLTRKVVKNLVNKYECETITVEQIQDEVENVLIDNDYKEVTKAYIIYRKQHENVRNMNSTLMDYKKLVDRYVERDDWRVKENSTSGYCVGGFILSNSGAVTANYWLNEVYDKEIADAHKNCDIHIHDLSMLSPYCSGNNLKQLILKGICGVPGHASSAPAKHLSTLCNQMVNFTGIMQNEWAGAQAFSSFDTYLAPFVKADNLSYADTKQAIQSYIYGSNVSSRWGSQAPFSNITLDWTIPDDLAELNCIVGGKEMDFKYKDCKKEMDMVNKAFLEVMIEGDSEGRGWEYPIPTYSITKDFDWSETENNKLLFEMAAKYGSPYFSNYINSDMKPSDVRSMAILGTQDVIYRTPDGRISKNEIRHLVHQWQKEPKKSYQFLMNGKFVDVTEMFEIPYSDYNDYVEIDLANGFKQPFSYDHKCIVLRDGTIQTVLSQDVKSGDKFLLAKNPYKENPENGDYNAGLMVGYYLAEGWVSHNGSEVDFAINIKRKDIVDSIKDFFNKLGCRVLVVEQNDVNIFKVKVFGKQAVGLVKNFISGDYATEKRLETNVLDMSFDFRKGMYDGYLDTDGSPKNGVFAHTTNKKLCEDLIVLSATLGITLKYSEDKNNTRYFKEDKSDLVRFTSYKLDIANFESYEDYWAVPVKEVKLMDASRITKVYNFTVDTKEHLYTLPNGIITHQCCRLRLDLRELRRQNGGNFGAGENTGSIGVVTINLPRIGYLSSDEDDFFKRLDHWMDVSARSLDVKRKVVSQLLNDGFYPYTKAYLGNFNNHFSTIGIIGMNEACVNAKWMNCTLLDKKAQDFSVRVLNHMRARLSDYQQEYGNLFNLEATPAESTTYRLAKHDKERYPDIITANENGAPYYTNSTHLPVDSTDDIFDALDIEDPMQVLYTSGTVFHAFLGERLSDWHSAAVLVRKIAENYKLPYFTLSPTYSVCPEHGYINGEVWKCPKCGRETEVYSRITGYYRPIKNWNDGKAQEFKDRKTYNIDKMEMKVNEDNMQTVEINHDNIQPKRNNEQRYILFTTKTCPNCKVTKSVLDKNGILYDVIDAEENEDLCKKYDIMQAPTLIVIDGKGGYEKYCNASNIIKFFNL